jgi:pimeloyl-ACP methyl ester carboxylesterase
MTMLDRHPWCLKLKDWLTANDLSHKSFQWQRAGGLCQLLVLGRPSDANRPNVIFLHGLGNDALFPNIELFRYLLSKGYNIITCDIDGHGQSSTTIFSAQTIETLVLDLISRCDEFLVGRPRLHLCGFSFGAALLLHYAVHHPERVMSLTLIGMPLHLATPMLFLGEILTPFMKSYIQAMRDYGVLGIQPALGPFLRHRYPMRLAAGETRNYIALAASIIDKIKPAEELRLVTFPTLCMAGSMDLIANYAATTEFINGLKGSMIQTFELKGETHFTSMLSPKGARRIEVLLRTSL